MNGWTKYFVDRTKETGTDQEVKAKKASWSKGRLFGMVGAEVVYKNKTISIMTPGRFWQSDDYEVNLYEEQPCLVVRRLQRQLVEGETLCTTIHTNSVLTVGPINLNVPWHSSCSILVVTEALAGKWFTLEYNLEKDEFSYRIEETIL